MKKKEKKDELEEVTKYTEAFIEGFKRAKEMLDDVEESEKYLEAYIEGFTRAKKIIALS